jgi:flagellar motor switch protein FliN/FliY
MRMAEDNGKDKEIDNQSENNTGVVPPEDIHEDGRQTEAGENSETQDSEASAVSSRIEKQSALPEAGPEISEKMQTVEDFDLNLLLDIPLEITVELGRTSIQIQELLELGPGSAVTLSKLEGEPVDILANEKLIARGEVVLQNKKYGIRITEITSRMDRIKSLH